MNIDQNKIILYQDDNEITRVAVRFADEALDSQILAHKRKVLIGRGTVSHKQAIEKAEQEFEIYRQREMEMLESDFDSKEA